MKTVTHTDNMHFSIKQFHVSLQLLFETFLAVLELTFKKHANTCNLHVKESTIVFQNWNGDQVS
jgi:hypothetical protein